MFIAGVNDTGEKLFSGINDTGEKFIGGVNDTGEYRVLPILACQHLKMKNKQIFYRWYRSEITKRPKIYRREKLFTGVNDTADKFIGGVNDTGEYRVLPILACQHLKMKNKQKFNL